MDHASLPTISDAEFEVMQVLWQEAPRDAEAIHRQLAARREWQLPTVKTLINRLLRKGAVRAEKEGRRYLYHPVLREEDWVAQQGLGFLDRVFDGRLSPLVSHFARHRKLKKADLEALRQLLKEHGDE
jgi:predicted transcriptional regulator